MALGDKNKEDIQEELLQEEDTSVFDASTLSPVEKNSFHTKLLPIYLLFLLAAFFALYIAPYFFDITNIWIKNSKNALLAFEYMRENGHFLAPILEKGLYLKEFPLVFWILYFVADFFPSVEASNLLFSSYIFSLCLFAFTTYFLALTLKLSSSVALGAVAIVFTSFFSLIYLQFVGFDLFFASFINLALAFFYRAWIKNFAPLLLVIAFCFTALSLFSGGLFALFLPLFTGLIFTCLYKSPKRLTANDGLLGAFILFVTSGIAFILFYYYEHAAYLALLSDIANFRKSWADAIFLEHIQHYLIFLILAFMPYTFLFFFYNGKETSKNNKAFSIFSVFKRKEKILSAVEVPDPSEVSEYQKEENSDTIIEVDEIVSLKQEDKYEESDIPTASFKLVDEKIEDTSEAENRAIHFLYCLVFVGLILLSLFPYTSFSYVLMIVPALSIIFSKKILCFSGTSSKLFFTIFAWTLVFLGFSAIFFAMLPELSLVRAEFFSFVPKIIVESFSQVPKISYFIFAFIDFTLALVLLFADKSVSWRAFSRSILAMLVLSWTLNFTVYPHIIFVEIDNIMEEVEIFQIEEYEENSAILDEGKALLEQSESILENGKYYLQLPKSLLPKDKSENELDIPEFDDPLEGIIPFTVPSFESKLPPQIPLEDLLELNNPNLPTYSL